MYRIEFFINTKQYTKEFDTLNNIEKFSQTLFESKTIVLDYHKAWLFENNKFLAIIDVVMKQIRYYSDMVFTDVKAFDYFKIPDSQQKDYYKFIVHSWGDIMYMGYSDYPDGTSNDLKRFFERFKHKDIVQSLEKMMEGDDDEKDEEREWIEEGMGINGHKYLKKNVVDCLLGIGMKKLTEPMVVYRLWGMYSGKSKSANYNGWVSTSIHDYTDTNLENIAERFVLPVGFPVCETEIDGEEYADDGEFIIRNEDLIQL